jgi:hypothetical protein
MKVTAFLFGSASFVTILCLLSCDSRYPITGVNLARIDGLVDPGDGTPKMTTLDYYGFNYASWWQGTFASADSTTAIRQMAGTGANTISISPTQFLGSRTGNTIAPNQQTETDANLQKAIAEATAAGMKVVFKPHIDVADWSASRTDIQASNPAAFFASYKSFIVHYAQMAQKAGVEIFAIGTELSKMTAPVHTPYWNDIIDAVRQVYTGKLTYAANYGEEKQVQFWDRLDFIGTDLYAPLTNVTNPTVDQLVQAWVGPPIASWSQTVYGGKPILDYYRDLSAAWGKPIFVTEIGFRSRDGANVEPWAFGKGGTVDQQEQTDLFTAFFKALEMKNTGWVKGLSIWDWRPVDMTKPNTLDPTDFTPQGKPALSVIEGFFDRQSAVAPPPPPPSPPPPPPPTQGALTPLEATFVMQKDWGQGYWGDVVVANAGTRAETGWTLTLQLPGASKIEQVWGLKVLSQSGQTIVLGASESWATTVPAGGSVKAGFVIGSATGASRALDFVEKTAGTTAPPPSPPPTPIEPVPTSPPTTGALPVFKPVSSWVMGGPTQKWIHGTDGNDVLAGTAGNDMIDGRKGGDTMSGGLGDDVYDIGPGEADRPVELAGQGIDTVLVRGSAWTLGAEFENLVAHSWQPTRLVGNDKDNVILGNRGDDVLVGGKGADLLTGGAGRDVFVYRDLLEGGDVVRDFQRGVDRLDLRELTAKLSGETVVFDKLASGLAVSVSVSGKTTALALLEGVTDGQLTLGTDVLVG